MKPFFLDIDPAAAADPAAPYAVLPAPYERTVTYGTGTGRGPAAILRASHEVEDFDEELRRAVDLRVQTLPAPRLKGLSDRAALDAIGAAAEAVLARGRFLLTLGGEHTVSVPAARAARRVRGVQAVLLLDAHLDLRAEYLGNRLSHACVARRLREAGLETVHAGARSCSAAEYGWATANRVPVVWARQVHAEPAASWMSRVLAPLRGKKIYLSVDIDVFDPGVAPATGTPEPGGLAWRQVSALLPRLFAAAEVVAADVTEVAPAPGCQVTEFAAARLGARILMHREYARPAPRPKRATPRASTRPAGGTD